MIKPKTEIYSTEVDNPLPHVIANYMHFQLQIVIFLSKFSASEFWKKDCQESVLIMSRVTGMSKKSLNGNHRSDELMHLGSGDQRSLYGVILKRPK